jgi:hypothetical protein
LRKTPTHQPPGVLAPATDVPRDPLEDKRARTEQTARHSEQSGRKQEENERARQRAWVDAIIETRRQDREREGGRER